MTTIFSNNEDIDSRFLTRLFTNIPNNKIIEIKYSMKLSDWSDKVEEALSDEDDTLILCGHGSPHGLYFPKFEDYIIHDMNQTLIHAKRIICFWCYASSFVQTYNIHNCICSSMFISNIDEAYYNGFYYSQNDICNISTQIYNELRELICSDIPISEWQVRLLNNMNKDNEIDVFNRQGIIYNP